jgi:molybdopterin/thiamine biosynthesis adenylyltransferase
MNLIQASRFKDAPWFPTEETYCIVGGAGGIGSWLTLLLSRAGFLPIVYDFDTFEEHNMSGQVVPKRLLGASKVAALQEVVKDFADIEIDIMNEKYTSESMSNHYVFSAFDNMQARKDMFTAWKAYVEEWRQTAGQPDGPPLHTPIFIDGRLTMEQMQIFCVTPDKIEAYEEHLFDDTEVPDAPCTLKQTSHSAAMIASHMTGFFTNHITNNAVGDVDRAVPFMWEYFIPINYINEL